MTQQGGQAGGRVLTRSEATAHGGRGGYIETPDHHLGVKFSVPQEIGGDGGVGTNPEQLFAAAYAASFQSAVGMVARRDGISFGTSQVTGVVGLRREDDSDPSYHLDVELQISLPGLSREEAGRMVQEARALCPYSRALGESAGVRLTVVEGETAG
ncbi:Ohr family peroxiredoxin [Deinococcus sp. MIMF12]|uniref:Ohr family peroxiredoxin n=1 Tax=Deinococcus rhizophilus TaxID=3049544 RepID=A0ABT7JDP7_9DEIO|nr:Ohr family peroxiredoxin [Deinococcus rhizophilus]MDL2343176.1 Ohr family peroxiredoxin [Deinococcus rhizophilus]